MKLAILTSGGDAPGMNAAIRSIVRYGNKQNIETFGVLGGFYGLINKDFYKLESKDVSGILSRGGTILKTTRFPDFSKDSVKEEAANNLKEFGITNLIVIGGNGSLAGGLGLSKFGINVIGIPGTIDNDIYGTDYTLGFNTALETIVSAIDKLRDTSVSHQRCSIVEVMGRDCGDLALYAAISGGAEFLITPDNPLSKELIIEKLKEYKRTDRTHAIIVVTEKMLDVQELAREITEKSKFTSNATTLGYVQRGGSPVPLDRLLASQMGKEAINSILNNINNVMIATINSQITTVSLADVINGKKAKNKLYNLIDEIS